MKVEEIMAHPFMIDAIHNIHSNKDYYYTLESHVKKDLDMLLLEFERVITQRELARVSDTTRPRSVPRSPRYPGVSNVCDF